MTDLRQQTLDQRLKKLILASGSPRRSLILRQIGLDFDMIPSNADEEKDVPSDPIEHVIELSWRKAREVKGKCSDGVILGADTVVVIDGQILGKPKDADDAFKMLSRLNNDCHEVYTGIT